MQEYDNILCQDWSQQTKKTAPLSQPPAVRAEYMKQMQSPRKRNNLYTDSDAIRPESKPTKALLISDKWRLVLTLRTLESWLLLCCHCICTLCGIKWTLIWRGMAILCWWVSHLAKAKSSFQAKTESSLSINQDRHMKVFTDLLSRRRDRNQTATPRDLSSCQDVPKIQTLSETFWVRSEPSESGIIQ